MISTSYYYLEKCVMQCYQWEKQKLLGKSKGFNTEPFYLIFFFLAFDFCQFCVVIRFFIPATTAIDLRLKGLLYQILSITLFPYLNYILNFYLFYNNYETSCSLATMFAFGRSSCGRKPECPEETHLSDLVTTWPSHMPTPAIVPGSQWWERVG